MQKNGEELEARGVGDLLLMWTPVARFVTFGARMIVRLSTSSAPHCWNITNASKMMDAVVICVLCSQKQDK